MLNIRTFTVEHLSEGCVTDQKNPSFAFSVDSDRQGASVQKTVLTVNGRQIQARGQTGIVYDGPALEPFTVYEAALSVTDDAGETAQAELAFRTGRMGAPWQGQWISDPAYSFKENMPINMN